MDTGKNNILAQLQKKYWIINGNGITKRLQASKRQDRGAKNTIHQHWHIKEF